MDDYIGRKYGSFHNHDIDQYTGSIWYDAALDIYVRKSDIWSWIVGSALFKFSYVRSSISCTIGYRIINSTILTTCSQYIGANPETIVDIVDSIHCDIRHRYEPLSVRIVFVAGMCGVVIYKTLQS